MFENIMCADFYGVPPDSSPRRTQEEYDRAIVLPFSCVVSTQKGT